MFRQSVNTLKSGCIFISAESDILRNSEILLESAFYNIIFKTIICTDP